MNGQQVDRFSINTLSSPYSIPNLLQSDQQALPHACNIHTKISSAIAKGRRNNMITRLLMRVDTSCKSVTVLNSRTNCTLRSVDLMLLSLIFLIAGAVMRHAQGQATSFHRVTSSEIITRKLHFGRQGMRRSGRINAPPMSDIPEKCSRRQSRGPSAILSFYGVL